MREKPCGEWLWILNMAVCMVVDVQMRAMGWMGWGFEKISGGAEGVY